MPARARPRVSMPDLSQTLSRARGEAMLMRSCGGLELFASAVLVASSGDDLVYPEHAHSGLCGRLETVLNDCPRMPYPIGCTNSTISGDSDETAVLSGSGSQFEDSVQRVTAGVLDQSGWNRLEGTSKGIHCESRPARFGLGCPTHGVGHASVNRTAPRQQLAARNSQRSGSQCVVQAPDDLLGARLAAATDLDGHDTGAGALLDPDDVLDLVGGLSALPDQRTTCPEVCRLDIEYRVDDVGSDSLSGVANLRFVQFAHCEDVLVGQAVQDVAVDLARA